MKTFIHIFALSLLTFISSYDVKSQSDDKTGIKEETLVTNENAGMYYSFFITTDEKHNLQDFLKTYPDMEVSVEQLDVNRYRIGRIRTHAKAVAVQEKMTAAGLLLNTLVAFENAKQIPVFLAMSKENVKAAEMAKR